LGYAQGVLGYAFGVLGYAFGVLGYAFGVSQQRSWSCARYFGVTFYDRAGHKINITAPPYTYAGSGL
jgi:hypothetical protein